MRKLLTILLMIPITFMFVSTHNFGLSAKNDFSELKEEISIANSYISKNHPEEKTTVKSYEIIKDTNENDSFILFKLNPVGYMFYSKENSEFVEYSFKDVSPYEYFGVDNEDKIYLGPTLYFTSHDEDVYCDVKHVYSYSKEALGIIESSFKESLSLEFSHMFIVIYK